MGLRGIYTYVYGIPNPYTYLSDNQTYQKEKAMESIKLNDNVIVSRENGDEYQARVVGFKTAPAENFVVVVDQNDNAFDVSLEHITKDE